MDDLLLISKSEELQEFSSSLGFSKVFFVEDILLLEEKNNDLLAKKIRGGKNKKKIVICRPTSEEQLRFLFEKCTPDVVWGMERIHHSDSLHHLRGGLNQVLGPLAAKSNAVVAFSFSEVLNCNTRGSLLGRMRFNLKLCRKYKIKTLFCNLSNSKEEIRSKNDLEAWKRVLEKG
ncbi:hypothetical protein HYU21_01865 [Candidatus Woesearchaeota archaeon]|nr:hypothetical protein [Candidatus Woesearchaeota archaeon]